MTDKQYIQYGCGWCAPIGWRNFDSSPTLLFERIPLLGRIYTKNRTRFPENVEHGDIITGLPVLDNSCQVVYCSHVLEHLSLNDFETGLKNTYKILADGGTFRFVMPDLEYSIRNYISNPSYEAAITFMRTTLLGKEQRTRNLQSLIVEWLGNSHHLWMWDYKSIEFELQKIGFTNVRRAYFGDSAHVIFQTVETLERWQDCLGVECQK